jgi:hypothetical protein
MPGAVARTSTFALNNATLPFALALADKGWRKACMENPHLAQGLNVAEGKVLHKAEGHVGTRGCLARLKELDEALPVVIDPLLQEAWRG